MKKKDLREFNMQTTYWRQEKQWKHWVTYEFVCVDGRTDQRMVKIQKNKTQQKWESSRKWSSLI